MSGTVKTDAQLAAEDATGQAPGSITPVNLLDIIASETGHFVNALATALPSASATQLYIGTGAAGGAAVATLGTNLSFSGTTLNANAGAAAGVSSFETRIGAVTLTSADVTTALSFTPYNVTNPNGYQTAANVTTAIDTALPNITASQLYRGTAAAGVAQALTLGTNLSISGSTLNAAGGGSSGSVVGFNTQTANYTLALSDAGVCVLMNVGSANTLTVPTNASVAFAVGQTIAFIQLGAGTTTIVPATGVTLNYASTLTTRAQYSSGYLLQIATNTWIVSGDMT